MPDPEDFFTPDSVDEQIEELTRPLTETTLPHSPGRPSHRLVLHLRHIYQSQAQENSKDLQDAWQHIRSGKQVDRHERPEKRTFSHNERNIRMQTRSSDTIHRQSQSPTARSLRHVLNMIALAACMIILIGSMVLVFHTIRQNHTGSSVQPVKSKKTATPTPALAGPGTTIYTFTAASSINSVDWSPDGKRIASTDTAVHVWDATTGRHVLTHVPPEGANFFVARWSPDGTRIVSTVPLAEVWNAATGKTLISCPYPNQQTLVTPSSATGGYLSAKSPFIPASMGPLPETIAWSPDGKYLAYPYPSPLNPMIIVWNAATCKIVATFHGHTDVSYDVAWSPDGKYLASASMDKTVQVWEFATHRLIYTYHDPSGLGIYRLAWSPDGKRIASTDSTSKTVDVWDALTGAHQIIYRGHSQSVTSIAWSPDSKRIASGSSYALNKSSNVGDVQIWNPQNGQHLFTYRGNPNPVLALAWSPNGKLIASADGSSGNEAANNTVKIWTTP
ncbi:MAG TPA: WD40 repeat domain-containing protein [Ktedonobacteraceae bacterium]|nr:WD40 repeat domain-containing protein [Ktedonobacteraceae bacterium]